MYRTLDTYTINLSRQIHRNSIDTFCGLLEKHNLMADFGGSLDALSGRKFEFTTSCSYKTFKVFFTMLYEVFGPFAAEVSFNEDYPPAGCGYNTTVNFRVNEEGRYSFALLNVLSMWENIELSEEYLKRRQNPKPPFESNCKEAGDISDWNKGGSLDRMEARRARRCEI